MSLKSLVKETAVYGLSSTLCKLISVLLVPIYTRYLSQTDFGGLDILISGMALISMILGMQIESGTARFYFECRDDQERSDLISTCFWLLWIPSGMFVASMFLFRNHLTGWLAAYSIPIQWLLITSATIPFNLQFFHSLLVVRFEKRPWIFLAFSFGNIALMGCLAIYFVVVRNFGITGVLIAQFISALTGFALIFRFILRPYISLRFQRKVARHVLFFSVPIIPSVGASWLQNFANRFLIVGFLGLGGVGLYSLAVKIGTIALFIQQAFQMAWVPHSMSLIGQDGSREYFSRIFSVYLAVMSVVILGITMFSNELVTLFAPISYMESTRFVGLITLGIILMGNTFFGLGNVIRKKTWFNTAGFVAGACVNLFLLQYFIGSLGLLAPAMTFPLGALVSNLVMLYFTTRNYPIPFSFGRYSFFLMIGTLLAYVRYTTLPVRGIFPLLLIAKAMLFMLCGAILFYGMLTGDDRKNLLQRINGVYQTPLRLFSFQIRDSQH